MTPGDQLKAISRLTMHDGLNYADYRDIGMWRDLAGPHWDFTVLSEKTCERIKAIFERFFTADGA